MVYEPKKSPLRRRREMTGLTQEEVAAASGIGLRSYQNYENLSSYPGVIPALRICITLRTTVETMWGDLAQF